MWGCIYVGVLILFWGVCTENGGLQAEETAVQRGAGEPTLSLL